MENKNLVEQFIQGNIEGGVPVYIINKAIEDILNTTDKTKCRLIAEAAIVKYHERLKEMYGADVTEADYDALQLLIMYTKD